MRASTLFYLARSFIACRFLGRRIPLALAFELTHKCNLDCPHCYARETVSGLGREEHLHIVDEAAHAGCKVISFTGGEPLLVPHLPELISRAKRHGMWVQFTTNGLLLPALENELARTGFNLIQLSLDGDKPTHEATRGQGSFAPVMSAIETIVRRRWRSLIVSVMTKHSTINDLTFAMAQALRMGGFISFQPICDMPQITPDRKEYEEFLDFLQAIRRNRSFSQIDRVLHRYGAKEMMDSTLPTRGKFYNPMDQSLTLLRYLRRFPDMGVLPCAAGKLFGRIRPDGQLVPCYYAIDREKPVNVIKDGFERAWKELNEPDCANCWHHHRLELNLIYNLSLPTLKNVLLYHLPGKFRG